MGSRRMLGFALGEHHDAELAYGALAMAVAVRGGQVARRHHAHRPGQRVHRGRRSARPAPGWASASRWAGPGRRWTTRSSNPGTPPWSSSCARLEHFATRAQARARVAAWIEEYNTHPAALGLRHDAPRRLGAGPRRRAGGRVSPAGRCAAQTRTEAASPPLTFDEKAAALGPGDAPREGTGPPLRRQGCCASLRRRPCGPALTPETTAAPQAGNTGRPQPARPGARRVR